MSDPGKAVFLSYASQDVEAAKRIAEALRLSGVEVWFDAEGGLEHGDEWDAKIRRQIKECVLFIPIVSANTEAREEGYFRIEWELAAQRALGIASGVAFILPVVIDATKEQEALVPDRFRAVQWTKLPGGNVPPEVLQRFLKLWSHRTGAMKGAGIQRTEDGGRIVAGVADPGPASARPATSIHARWLLPTIAAAAVIAIGAWFVLRPSSSVPGISSAQAPTPDPKSQTLDARSAADPKLSEAGRLIDQAWALFEKMDDASNDEWILAEEYAEQATRLEPRNAEAWAVYANVTVMRRVFGLDLNPERLGRATKAAQRAVNLDPQSVNARVAVANIYRLVDDSMRAEAEQVIRTLMIEQPTNKRVQRMGGNVLRQAYKFDEALAAYDRAMALPGGDRVSLFGKERTLKMLGRFAEAEALVDAALASNPSPALRLRKIYHVLVYHDDPVGAGKLLDDVPGEFLLREEAVDLAASVWLGQRNADKCIALLRRYPGETIRGTWKGGLIGVAYRMSGRIEAARLEWQATLKLVDARLAAQPNDTNALFQKVLLLAALANRPEAETLWRTYEQLEPPSGAKGYFVQAMALTELGHLDEAVAALEKSVQATATPMTTLERRADLRRGPLFDPLRSHPRFQALLDRLNAMPIGTAAASRQSSMPGSRPRILDLGSVSRASRDSLLALASVPQGGEAAPERLRTEEIAGCRGAISD
ncbi:MAG TPA: TIR domain-containing protein [Lacunisphaera sp.]|nr:TIR domain-containing protein [Lacunisphaera sp.]